MDLSLAVAWCDVLAHSLEKHGGVGEVRCLLFIQCLGKTSHFSITLPLMVVIVVTASKIKECPFPPYNRRSNLLRLSLVTLPIV